jgi:dethiobiotin synthetase
VYKFVPPVSPDLRRAGRSGIDSQNQSAKSSLHDWLVVEGAGGVRYRSPKQLKRDLMVKSKLPVILGA